VNAVRADIADVRLAAHVFAPHYAAPLPVAVIRDVMLREGRNIDSADMVALSAGDMFDLLDVTGGVAWGVASAHGLVGYVEATALGGGSA